MSTYPFFDRKDNLFNNRLKIIPFLQATLFLPVKVCSRISFPTVDNEVFATGFRQKGTYPTPPNQLKQIGVAQFQSS